MMNPMQMIMQLMMGGNPMQMMQQMFGNNPMFQQAVNMTQGKNPEDLEQVAQNICQQKGIDYNQIKNQFSQTGIKFPGSK